MEAEALQEFIRQAEIYLPTIRGGILVCSQESNAYGELNSSLRQVQEVKNAASAIDLADIKNAAEKLEVELEPLAAAKEQLSEEQSRALLDKVAVLEANLTKISFSSDFFPADFIDESFENLRVNRSSNNAEEIEEKFEIDDEMLEVFTIEAEDLLRNMNLHLERLEKNPNSGEALLEVRRDAHTLKGSAGIVGLKRLSDLAHRVEDLLDYLAENKLDADAGVFELLVTAIDCFGMLANGETSIQLEKKIERLYKNFDEVFSLLKESKKKAANGETRSNKAADETPARVEQNRPMIRVSLEKLDELVKIVGALRVSRSAFEQRLSGVDRAAEHNENGASQKENVERLFDNQRSLIDEIQDKLLRLRLVKFGALSARLQRTVRSTCEEESKYANLLIEGEELEFDTQILDSLAEPLLHLLRNAVAHGIESPETRRLLGKEEFGKIFLSVSSDETHINLTISDDGRGISAASLIEKAVQNNFITVPEAAKMTEQEAFSLVFLPGLTTADKLSQVAGRGVGMNIVKTAVSRSDGEISVHSKPHKGTIFKIRLPMVSSLKFVKTNAENPALTVGNSNKILNVMIVDDSPGMRLASARFIKSMGWRTVVANDGFEAMEILQGSVKPPDIILTDVEMPRMNGFEFLNFLKQRESLKEIPVIMITSRDGDNDRQKALDLGVSAYLTKPYVDSFLLEKINELTR